MLQLMLKNRSL